VDIKRTRENDDHDRSPRRDEVRGEILHGERFFVERLSPWTDVSEEQKSSWREQPRREILYGETLSVEKPLRRDNLQGENISVERLFKERGAPGRARFQLAKLRRLVLYVTHSVGLLPPAVSLYTFCNLASLAYVLFYAFQGFDLI
jgi:hypothetical protein